MTCSAQLIPRWLSQWTLFCLISGVISQTHIPGIKRSRHLKLNLPIQWKNALQTERIKEDILHRLNISKPPFITPRDLDITDIKTRRREPPVNFDDQERKGNVSLSFAEATDPYKKDMMLFKIHSTIRDQIPNIDNMLIIIRLRPNKKRSSSSGAKKLPEKRTNLEKLCAEYTPTKSPTESSSGRPQINVSKECHEEIRRISKNSKMLRRLQRKRKRLHRARSRKIKIIVRVIDPVTNKRRRIFVEKMVLKKTKIFSVPVPKKLFTAAAESPSHALTVQVTCRNCRRHVKMDKVYRKGGRKNSSKNSLRLNPNRPYLYIRYHHNSKTNDISKQRSKRHLSSNSCSNFDNILQNKDTLSDYDLECCQELTYYTFEELGLSDLIIYPNGFNTVECLGSCRNHNSVRSTKQSTTTTPWEALENVASQGSSGQQCLSTAKSHLDILYFGDSNNIIPGRLVNFVGESCGCAAL